MPIDFEDSLMSSGYTTKALVNNNGSNNKNPSLREEDNLNVRSSVSNDSDNIIKSKGFHNS